MLVRVLKSLPRRLSRLIVLLALAAAVFGSPSAGAGGSSSVDRDILIGVLSHRGSLATKRTWTPTAKYLAKALPGHRFRIVPLDFSEIDPAVGSGQVDFVLVNPGIYVNLEVRHRVSRIATLRNRVGNREVNVFGGVIFTRASESGIRSAEDLRGHSMMAVDPTSLGGFEMAWGEMAAHGIDPR